PNRRRIPGFVGTSLAAAYSFTPWSSPSPETGGEQTPFPGEMRSVQSCITKPLIGLLVLLAWPCLGPGGSARACFVLRQSATNPGQAKSSAGPALLVTLDAEADGYGIASSGGAGDEDHPTKDDLPRGVRLPLELTPAWTGLQTSSSTGGMFSPPIGSG